MEGSDKELKVFQIKFQRKKKKSKSVYKRVSLKAFGIFNKSNSMKKYILLNSVLIFVRTI